MSLHLHVFLCVIFHQSMHEMFSVNEVYTCFFVFVCPQTDEVYVVEFAQKTFVT